VNSQVLWDIVVCRQINIRRRFGGVYCLRLQRLSSPKHAVCVQKLVEQYKHCYLSRSNMSFPLFFPCFIVSFFLYSYYTLTFLYCSQFLCPVWDNTSADYATLHIMLYTVSPVDATHCWHVSFCFVLHARCASKATQRNYTEYRLISATLTCIKSTNGEVKNSMHMCGTNNSPNCGVGLGL
jgi:hypothetical protein